MKAFYFLSLSLILIGHFASASGENAEWLKCSTTDDCIAISIGCANGAVHRKFEEPARKFYAAQNATRDCAISSPSSKARATICENGQCAFRKNTSERDH